LREYENQANVAYRVDVGPRPNLMKLMTGRKV